MRRLRRTKALRDLVRETELSPRHLVQPLFVVAGEGVREPVESMPGIERFSISELVAEASELQAVGVEAVILFGIPAAKDEAGSGAYDDEGVVQIAVRALKEAHPELTVITDVCLCEYTSHGHCGFVRDGEVDNDITVELLARDRDLARRRRRRRGRALGHDGRPGRGDPPPARRGGPPRHADHRLLGEVRLGLLRPVPRGGRVDARSSATGAGTRWTRPTPARRCARRGSTSTRAPTW